MSPYVPVFPRHQSSHQIHNVTKLRDWGSERASQYQSSHQVHIVTKHFIGGPKRKNTKQKYQTKTPNNTPTFKHQTLTDLRIDIWACSRWVRSTGKCRSNPPHFPPFPRPQSPQRHSGWVISVTSSSPTKSVRCIVHVKNVPKKVSLAKFSTLPKTHAYFRRVPVYCLCFCLNLLRLFISSVL